MKDLNNYLEKIYIDYVNDYRSIAKFAEATNLSLQQARGLIALAKEVYYQDVEMTIIGLED